MTGFLVLLCVVALVLINVPIAVALCIASVIAMITTQGMGSLPNVSIALYQGATSFPLIAIPLFILVGGDHERLGHLAPADRLLPGARSAGCGGRWPR